MKATVGQASNDAGPDPKTEPCALLLTQSERPLVPGLFFEEMADNVWVRRDTAPARDDTLPWWQH